MAVSVETILVRLNELKPQILKKFRAREIQLFGSYVRGDQKANSDIDILVDFEEGAELFDLTGLSIFLEEIFQRQVDIVPRDALRSELQQSVMNEAILV